MLRSTGVSVAVVVLLSAGSALATVGGGDVVFKNKGGNVEFSHQAHVAGANLTCQACHPKLFVNAKQRKPATMKQMEQGKSCGACHNGKVAFSVKGDCKSCHQ